MEPSEGGQRPTSHRAFVKKRMVHEGKGVRSAHLAKPNRPAVRRATSRRAAANSATIALNGSLDAAKGCGEAERLDWFWGWLTITGKEKTG